MPITEMLLLCLAAVAIAATVAVYSYGRFARRARGVPSRSLPVADGATALDRVIGPLLRGHDGETGMLLLPDNLEAFEMRVLAARNAGRSLDLLYYYWLEDLTGGMLAKEVCDAADRGVRVRMLIDDINTRGNDLGYLRLDSHPNIEVRLFNPSRNRSNGLRRGLELALRAFKVTRRMHNKAWIADGRLAIVGGRNIGDAYFDASQTVNFHDMDLLFVGQELHGAQAIFDDFWNSEAAIPINALSRPISRRLPPIPRRGKGRSAHPVAEPYLERLAEIEKEDAILSLEGRLRWSNDVEVVSDPPGKALAVDERDWLVERIYKSIAAARTELSIVSPYFIPGDRGVTALTRLAERGAKISVLTNSLAATDVVAVHGAYASYRKPLLKAGISLFELRPNALREGVSLFGSKGASLHTKAFTVDGRCGFVGLFNFDPRSASLNTEMGVLFSHPELVGQMRDIIAQQTAPHFAFKLAVVDEALTWSGDEAVGEAIHRSEPGAGFWRRLSASAIGLLPIESQL